MLLRFHISSLHFTKISTKIPDTSYVIIKTAFSCSNYIFIEKFTRETNVALQKSKFSSFLEKTLSLMGILNFVLNLD
jgi:hypothetical protein